MNTPGFSTPRTKPFKPGPLTTVASVSEARSLTSLAKTATFAAAPLLSVSYLPFKDAFIVIVSKAVGEKRRRGREERMLRVLWKPIFALFLCWV